MPHRIQLLLDLASSFSVQFQMFLASMLAGITFLADVTTDLKGYEDASVKVLLAGALIWLAKLYVAQNKEHKTEMAETLKAHKAELVAAWADHRHDMKERDLANQMVIKSQGEALDKLVAETKVQTEALKVYARQALEEKVSKPHIP